MNQLNWVQLDMPCFNTQLTKTGQFLAKVYIIPKSEILESGGKINLENRRGCIALVDTGANRSAISEEIAKELNLTPTGKISIRTAGHPVDCNVYEIHMVIPVQEIIGLKQIEKEGKVATVPESMLHIRGWPVSAHALPKQKEHRGFDCLIGMDILATCTFQYADGVLRICW